MNINDPKTPNYHQIPIQVYYNILTRDYRPCSSDIFALMKLWLALGSILLLFPNRLARDLGRR